MIESSVNGKSEVKNRARSFSVGHSDNTSHKIKRTGKMIKIDRNNAFSGLKFDTEGAKI